MNDHINISHPGVRNRFIESQVEIEKLRTELAIVKSALAEAQGDLRSIFSRIAAGEPVELHYPDGSMIVAVKGRPRGEKQ